jgi:demethylmenaquinone methyltransferase/2-methoxy-6-polyprenyl-1,4-benzoquinol methylase
VFSYIFMKILEGRPRSYDRRMDKASRGRVRAIKEAVAAEVPQGARVLEIGCGTGELAAMMIGRGATVDGFDASPTMVEVVRERIAEEGLEGKLTVRQMGVDGMDGLQASEYDAVVSTLVFSELNEDERRYALKHAVRVLKPGRLIVIADEVVPRKAAPRILHSVVRAPMLAMTYLVSGTSTRPIPDLSGELAEAGFHIEEEVRSHGDAFALVKGSLSRGKEA